jgi:predicted ArsR family transcriptional regulator
MSNVLMNRTRSRIVRFLVRSGPATCAEISDQLRVSRSAIRRHLDVLHQAGLVSGASGEFDASREQIQAEVEDLAAKFGRSVMPPAAPRPMN